VPGAEQLKLAAAFEEGRNFRLNSARHQPGRRNILSRWIGPKLERLSQKRGILLFQFEFSINDRI